MAREMAQLMGVAERCPMPVRRQIVAVVEEFDLLRFYLRQTALQAAIDGPGMDDAATAAKPVRRPQAPAKGKAKR